MICFRSFTAPLWEIFAGNLLLLFCSLCYLAWWVVSFNPNSSGGSAGMFYIAAAFIIGVVAIFLTSSGIKWLSQDSKSLPVSFILLGSVAVFIILLLVTTIAFHRMVTSELLIIHIWAALELSMVVVLYGTGHFGFGRVAILSALIGIAFIASLICYILYYRLDGTASYWAGMIPLIMDAFVMSVFLGVLAVL
ncbi:MAG: hypothetical protein JJE17_04350 [Peptostreptococcaceae bacterium]|nr:hypothetical protein [Peptostreptococcaceae bacterium]